MMERGLPLWLALIVGGAAAYVVLSLPTVHIGNMLEPIQWRAALAVIGFAAGLGALLGLVARKSSRKDTLSAVIRVVAAVLFAGFAAVLVQRWIASTHFVVLAFIVTRAVWNAFVRDVPTGIFFCLLGLPFTVIIDFVLLLFTALGATLVPFVAMVCGPTLGAATGQLVASLALRLARR